MHGLTSVLFLPSMLEVLSPHLRPYLLMSHFRLVVAYWVSRGRPELYISEGLMMATAVPAPPASSSSSSSSAPARDSAVRRALEKARARAQQGGDSDNQQSSYEKTPPNLEEDANANADGGGDPYTNPWLKVLQSAVDHDDEHVTKVVRSLYWAATQFGASPRGMFTSSLPGSEDMDGTIFIRGELGRPSILLSFFFPRETRLITRG